MMRSMKYIHLLILLACASIAKAQDLHFSQYFNAPLLVNPANTGFNPDYDYRIGGNYRNQWAGLINNPYKTMSLWGDVQLLTNSIESGWLGVGGVILRDVAGSGDLTSTQTYASVAYHQMLGYSGLLSLGFNVGAVNKRVDLNKLTFDNQWNGKFFDNNINPNEPFAYSGTTYLDLQVGMNYAYFPSDRAYLNIGFSVMHLNRPSESFFAPSTVNDQRIARRYTAFVNGNFKVGDLWIVNPNVYVSKMASSTETVLGMNANRNLSGDGGAQQLIVGLYYRAGDSFIPMIGYQLEDVKFTFSYDVTTSSLGAYNGKQGAYELSIIKSGTFGNKQRGLKCPTVKF